MELRVVDAGPGVPRRERESLFAPFRRLGADPSDRDGRAGVGLGLAVARGFTEVMGGTLTAEDTPGGGLTVVVALPAARPRRRGARVTHKVLVVDDDPQILRTLRINLTAHGYRVRARPGRRPRRCGPPPTSNPTSSSSTSACPTWTAPR